MPKGVKVLDDSLEAVHDRWIRPLDGLEHRLRHEPGSRWRHSHLSLEIRKGVTAPRFEGEIQAWTAVPAAHRGARVTGLSWVIGGASGQPPIPSLVVRPGRNFAGCGPSLEESVVRHSDGAGLQ
jgi:hypothetical protein